MKKAITIIALVVVCVVAVAKNVAAVEISDERKNMIIAHCDAIKEDLKDLQHRDSRARVYLGKHYEIILNKFITSLNVRLVDNNLVNDGLIDNQNAFSKARTNFNIDYIEYQKVLENLVAMDCKKEPAKFYEKLENARLKRGIVSKDAAKMKTLAEEQVNLVEKLKGTL